MVSSLAFTELVREIKIGIVISLIYKKWLFFFIQ